MNTLKKIAAAVAAAAVTSVSVCSFAVSAIDPVEDPPYTAFISISAGAHQQWEPGDLEGESASITGDGSYRTSVVIPDGSGTIELLILDTNINAFAFVEKDKDPLTEGTAKIKIDSIMVERTDGTSTEIPFTLDDTSFRLADNGTALRYSFLDQWTAGTKVACMDTNVPGGIGDGDSVVINFTVSGINAGGGTATTDDGSSSNDNTGNNDNNGGSNNAGGNGNTTTAATNADGTPATTTTTAAGNSNNSNNNNNSNSSSNKNNTSASGNNATTSQTGDFGIAAVVLGAVATLALGAGAYTITKRKK